MGETFKKRLKLNGYDYHLRNTQVLNAIMGNPLTDGEVRVLSAFMLVGGFGRAERAEVMRLLDVKATNLANFIKFLVAKGFLVRGSANDGKATLQIPDKIKCSPTNQTFIIELIHE